MKLLCAALLFSALPMLAAEPFTGTWKEDITTRKASGKPTRIELSNGIYKCLSCNPPYTVKADGTDQAVPGQPGFDTLSVRIIDDRSAELIAKKAGKILSRAKYTVSSDGATRTNEGTSYPAASDKPVTSTTTSKRVGNSMAGMHIVSGSWVPDKMVSLSENALLNTFEQTADGLKWSSATGEHYDAKLDGKVYPVAGSRTWDKVTLKRLGPNSIEETDLNGDKVLGTTRYTVSPDGQSMTLEARNTRTGRTITSILRKQ